MIFLNVLCQVSGLYFPQALHAYYWPRLKFLLAPMRKALERRGGFNPQGCYISDWLDCTIADDSPERVFFFCLLPWHSFPQGLHGYECPCLMSMTHHYIGPHALRRYTHKRAGRSVMEPIGVIGLS